MSAQLAGLIPYDSQTAKVAQAKCAAKKRANPQTPAKRQALNLQHALHKAGQALSADIPVVEEPESRARIACALASVAKGWQSMTDQIRILSGKAAPGTLSPAERRAKALERKQPIRSTQPKLVTPSVPSETVEPKESLSQG